MAWRVDFDPDFEPEFARLEPAVQDEILAQATLIETFGPDLGRPRVDTLKGSIHANMKELRFEVAGGAWRVAFAFDPERKAILLVAGNKSGVGQVRFYKVLIRRADERFSQHLVRLRKGHDDEHSSGKNRRSSGRTPRRR